MIREFLIIISAFVSNVAWATNNSTSVKSEIENLISQHFDGVYANSKVLKVWEQQPHLSVKGSVDAAKDIVRALVSGQSLGTLEDHQEDIRKDPAIFNGYYFGKLFQSACAEVMEKYQESQGKALIIPIQTEIISTDYLPDDYTIQGKSMLAKIDENIDDSSKYSDLQRRVIQKQLQDITVNSHYDIVADVPYIDPDAQEVSCYETYSTAEYYATFFSDEDDPEKVKQECSRYCHYYKFPELHDYLLHRYNDVMLYLEHFKIYDLLMTFVKAKYRTYIEQNMENLKFAKFVEGGQDTVDLKEEDVRRLKQRGVLRHEGKIEFYGIDQNFLRKVQLSLDTFPLCPSGSIEAGLREIDSNDLLKHDEDELEQAYQFRRLMEVFVQVSTTPFAEVNAVSHRNARALMSYSLLSNKRFLEFCEEHLLDPISFIRVVTQSDGGDDFSIILGASDRTAPWAELANKWMKIPFASRDFLFPSYSGFDPDAPLRWLALSDAIIGFCRNKNQWQPGVKYELNLSPSLKEHYKPGNDHYIDSIMRSLFMIDMWELYEEYHITDVEDFNRRLFTALGLDLDELDKNGKIAQAVRFKLRMFEEE